MIWFHFSARHHRRDFVEAIACEMFGTPRTILRTSGKVRAWTRWGARRHIRRLLGSHLLEIVDVSRKAVGS